MRTEAECGQRVDFSCASSCSQTSTEVNEPTCCFWALWIYVRPGGSPVHPGALVSLGDAHRHILRPVGSRKKKKIFLATAIFHYLTGLLQKQYHQSALTSEEGVVFWKCKHPRKPAWEKRTLSAECRPVSQQYPTRIVPSVSDCRANTSAGATKCSTRPVNKIQVEVTCKEWTNSNNPFYCVAILSHEDALQTGASARRETEVM